MDDCDFQILAGIDRLANGKVGVVVRYTDLAREVDMSIETVKSIVAKMPRDFVNATYNDCSLRPEGRAQLPP